MWYNSFGKVIALVLLVFVALTAIAFSLLVYAQYRTLQQPTNVNTANTNLTLTTITPDVDDDPALGSKTAAVEIIAFEDFQCPYCEAEEPVLQQLFLEYPNDIHFVYRDFPLYTIHDQAIAAAQAGECADAQGKFWEWHDQAFLHQADLDQAPAVFTTWATTAGLDATSFDQCVTAETYKNEVQKDMDEGLLAGVSATPTFFVNGQKYTGALSIAQWRDIMDAALAK